MLETMHRDTNANLYPIQTFLKGSYDVAKKNIILCIWCNAMCLCGLWFKKHIIFHILYIIVASLCSTFLKHIDFYKAHHFESEVCSDWPAIQCVVIGGYCYCSFGSPNKVVSLSQRNTVSPGHGAGGSNNTTARIKITPSFFAYTFGRCFANLPTQWRRHVGVCLNEPF